MLEMKKLLILLLSLFFLSPSSVFAEDISDFHIEGMSVGDSLLDYMTEDEILQEIEISLSLNEYSYLKESYKYLAVYLYENFPVYKNGLSFFIKNDLSDLYVGNTNKNEKYTILSVRGLIDYIEDFDNCIVKRDEIAEILSGMFPNTPKEEIDYIHSADPSGKSIKDDVYFEFNSGDEISVSCDNFEETFRIEKNYIEGLNVSIDSGEIIEWFLNK